MAVMIRGSRNPWMPNPFDEMMRISDSWDVEPSQVRGIAADVYETDDEVVVKMALPGVKPNDISISVTGDTLTVTGEVVEEKEEKKRDYYQKQIRQGSFAQSVVLPTSVQADKTAAHFSHGFLKVSLPKKEEDKPRQIQIKVD